MKKKKGLIWLIVVMAVVLTGCTQKNANTAKTSKDQDSWSKIEKKGEVVMGIDDSFPPMGFRDEDDKIVGFDIDLAKVVFEEVGLTVKYQPIDWSMKETELKNGTIDVIWNGYTVTPARKKQVAFSHTYLNNEQVLVSLKKNNINSYEDMQGKSLGAQSGSSGLDSLEAEPELLLDKIKDGEPVLYENFVDAFMDMEAGRIQGVFIDSVCAGYYIANSDKKAEFVVLPSKIEPEDYAIGVRKADKKLLAKINEGLKKAYDDGKAKEISEQWFGTDKIVAQD